MTARCPVYMPQAKEQCGRAVAHSGHHRSLTALKAGKVAQRQGELVAGDGLGALERYAAMGLELPGDTLAAKIRERLAARD